MKKLLEKLKFRKGAKGKTKTKKAKTRFGKKTSIILYVCCWLLALTPVMVITYLFSSQSESDLPSVEMLENPPELLASVIYADDGKTELGRYWSVNRTSVAYKDISPFVFDALIATEDERFLEHSGIDFRGLARAITNMGNAGGASTISQQLAKLLFTLQERERIAALRAEGKPVPAGPTGFRKRLNEKIKENIIAIRLEERYTKEEIITMYLNQFDFLHNAVGIENAAKVYFNKKPIDLTKTEAAMLVGMCKNPSLYNPQTYQIKDYRSNAAKANNVSVENVSESQMRVLRSEDSVRAHERRNQVLFQWKRSTIAENQALKNFMTQGEYDTLTKQHQATNYQIVDHKQGIAPYFRESLRSQLTDLFKKRSPDGKLVYAKKDGSAYNVYRDGLKVYTTINVSLQTYAEGAMKRHLSETLQPEFDKNNRNLKRPPFTNRINEEVAESLMNSGRKQSERFRAMKAAGLSTTEIEKSFELPTQMRIFSWGGDIDTILTPNDSIRYYKGILQSGLMSLEPSTGFVKAWVGGVDFHHFAYDHVKQGTRQVGSTIKPFVYSTALAMGVVQPCTKLKGGINTCVDVFGSMGNIESRWCPAGELDQDRSVEYCLATSNNPGTVQVMKKMGGYAGPKNISKLLKDLEIDLRPEDEVPSMCLGVMDLSVYQMVAAQAMLVNNGIYNRPTTVLRIEDRRGNIIYSAEPYSKEVLNANLAHRVLLMMKGVVQYGTGTSLRGTYHPWGGLTYPMAGKTGTTQSNADGWYMGLTPDLVTGVWVGADDRAVRFKSMTWGQGARMALPIFGYYMQKAYKDTDLKISREDFEEPIGFDASEFNCDNEENGGSFLNFGVN
ncbi:MAG: penicillin-binding protein 1A [Crocinitomicaceae bacterium]|jgi:penicillin-binding protein 1A